MKSIGLKRMKADENGIVYMTPKQPRLTPIERKPTLADALSTARITARLAEQAWQQCQARLTPEAVEYGRFQYAQGRADALAEVVDREGRE